MYSNQVHFTLKTEPFSQQLEIITDCDQFGKVSLIYSVNVPFSIIFPLFKSLSDLSQVKASPTYYMSSILCSACCSKQLNLKFQVFILTVSGRTLTQELRRMLGTQFLKVRSIFLFILINYSVVFIWFFENYQLSNISRQLFSDN